MDRHISVLLIPVVFAFLSSGCFTTQNNKDLVAVAGGKSGHITEDAPKVAKKDEGPKRPPQPRTEIAFGAMKEREADSENGKKDPEAQARMRDEARQAYQAALKSDPTNLDAHRHLGRLYVKIGDYDRAFDTYKKAMARHPKEHVLWYELGLCHQRRRDFGESTRCFHKALEMDPENREYMKKLGFTLAYTGNLDQGLTYLTRAQGSALAHYNLARVLVQREQIDPARHHLRLALSENANLEDARALLASLESGSTPRTPTAESSRRGG